MVLPELREQVVGEESHGARQGKEHDAEEGLQRRERSKVNGDTLVSERCRHPPSRLPSHIFFFLHVHVIYVLVYIHVYA